MKFLAARLRDMRTVYIPYAYAKIRTGNKCVSFQAR